MMDQIQTNHLSETRLYEYLDGALSPAETAATLQHLQQCSSCQAQVHDIQVLFSALDGLPDIPIYVDLAPGVLSSITTQESIWQSGRWLAILQAVIAAAVLIFSWPLLLPGSGQPLSNLSIQVERWFAGLPNTMVLTWAAWSIAANDLLVQTQDLFRGAVTDLLPRFEIWPWIAILGVLWLIVNGFLLRPGDGGGLTRQINGTVRH